MKDLVVLTPAYYSDIRAIGYLLDSCRLLDVPLEPYGLGQPYLGWIAVKVHGLLPMLRGQQDAGRTHFIYTDGGDSFFLAGMDEIVGKYQQLGSPGILLSAEKDCYPISEISLRFPDPGTPFRYINAGGFMGRIDVIAERLVLRIRPCSMTRSRPICCPLIVWKISQPLSITAPGSSPSMNAAFHQA